MLGEASTPPPSHSYGSATKITAKQFLYDL